MPQRQLMVFRIGCMAAVLAAVVHLIAHLAGPRPPANQTEAEIARLSTTYEYALPGGAKRSLRDRLDGFSLTVPVLLASLGGVGYLVQKRAAADARLMNAVARVLAAAAAVLLVISLTSFSIVPALFMGLIATCFAMASVQSPA